MDPRALAYYYSSWQVQAIYTLLAIPGFADPETIAIRLALPRAFVFRCLNRLCELGLVDVFEDRFRALNRNLHLGCDSPQIGPFHAAWRHCAIQNIPLQKGEEVHFSSLLGISRADYERLRQIVVEFIAKVRHQALDSDKEDLYCLNIDLFRV